MFSIGSKSRGDLAIIATVGHLTDLRWIILSMVVFYKYPYGVLYSVSGFLVFCLVSIWKVQSVKSINPYFLFFGKEYSGIFKCLYFWKNNGFLKFYAVVDISQKILWNGNGSIIKTVIFTKRTMRYWQLFLRKTKILVDFIDCTYVFGIYMHCRSCGTFL